MSEVKAVKSITGDVAFAAAQGRKFTDARNALIAYGVLVLEVSQADMVRETGVDKGDVSRVVKQAKASPDALAALKSLDRMGERDKRINAAAPLGEAFLRRPKRERVEPAAPEAPKGGSLKPDHGNIVHGDESDPVFDAVAAVYPVALALTDEGRDRLALVLADALRQAKIDARRIAAGREPQGFTVPAVEVAA